VPNAVPHFAVRGGNPKFYRLFNVDTLVAPSITAETAECRCTTTNRPYPMMSKWFLSSNGLMVILHLKTWCANEKNVKLSLPKTF